MTWLIKGKPGTSIDDYELPTSDEILRLLRHFEGSLKQLLVAMVPNRNLKKSIGMVILEQLENDNLLGKFAEIRERAEIANIILMEDEIQAMADTDGADKFKTIKNSLEKLNANKWGVKLKRAGGDQATKNSTMNDLDDDD
jgi:hypothetical protein